jgi:hypothetical protein
MVNYEALYKALFNGLTDAIRELDRHNYGSARQTLVKAQQEAEEMFMSDVGDEGEIDREQSVV